MEFPLFLSFLLVSVVQIWSSPLPQDPEPEKIGWTAPPIGWTPGPPGLTPGWTPSPPAPLTSGVVVAAGETAVGSNLTSASTASDNITLDFEASYYSTDTDVVVATYLGPTNDMGAGFGSLNASVPGATVESDYGGIDFFGNGDESNTAVLDMYTVEFSSNPTSSASSTFGSLATSSFVAITDGSGLAPVGGGSGWKKE